jgi:hypothetical protein
MWRGSEIHGQVKMIQTSATFTTKDSLVYQFIIRLTGLGPILEKVMEKIMS